MKSIRIIFVLLSSFIFSCQIPAMDNPNVSQATAQFQDFFGYNMTFNVKKPQFWNQVLKAIAGGADINELINGEIPLIRALEADAPNEVVHAFINAGADVNRADLKGETPLMYTAKQNQPELMRILIKAGANVNSKMKNGNTALHEAYDPQIMGLLIDAGADINSTNTAELTPLQTAVLYAQADRMRVLLNAGADVNAVDNNGVTLLMRAISFEASLSLPMIKLLRDYGADPLLRANDGRTALDFALAEGDQQVIKLLQDWIAEYQKKKI